LLNKLCEVFVCSRAAGSYSSSSCANVRDVREAKCTLLIVRHLFLFCSQLELKV